MLFEVWEFGSGKGGCLSVSILVVVMLKWRRKKECLMFGSGKDGCLSISILVVLVDGDDVGMKKKEKECLRCGREWQGWVVSIYIGGGGGWW